MKRYKIIDTYEGYVTIGYANTVTEVKGIATEFIEATDGECDIFVMTLNDEHQKYVRKSMQSYSNFCK